MNNYNLFRLKFLKIIKKNLCIFIKSGLEYAKQSLAAFTIAVILYNFNEVSAYFFSAQRYRSEKWRIEPSYYKTEFCHILTTNDYEPKFSKNKIT